jgi:tRNA pseudouridine55 synthase
VTPTSERAGHAQPGEPSGLVVVDKPTGPTSHDVVARVRRLAGTRRVGHAGTLDPAASGVLLLGLGRATKLLGHLALVDKDYLATIRLGASTTTDDAEGDVVGSASAVAVTDEQVRAVAVGLTGSSMQVPSSVSAVKVDGVRAYARVRAGEQVELAARPVVVTAFDVLAVRRPTSDLMDLDVAVSCSTGTYVRALARDLGRQLGVGGHLVGLRRTRVGAFDLGQARTLEALERDFGYIPLAAAVATQFARLDVDLETAAAVRYGRPLPSAGPAAGAAPVGVFGPDGAVLALMAERDGALRPLVVFAPA